MGSRQESTEAIGMSLEGRKITYLKDKFASSTTTILVNAFCKVQGENIVFGVGGKEPFYFDVVKLVKENPSCTVEKISAADLTPQFCAALERPQKRKAAVRAAANLGEPSTSESEGEDYAPVQPRRRVARPQEPQQRPAQCVVCVEATATFAIQPCGHLCICALCAGRAEIQMRVCPLCRTPVDRVQRIYTS